MTSPTIGNRLLSPLPECNYTELMHASRQVELRPGQILHEPDEPQEHVYFPLSGVISLLTVLDDSALEVAMVGNEGMADLAAYFGLVSTQRWLVQNAGQALRFEVAQLRDYAAECEPLQKLIEQYMLAMFVCVAQVSACARRHPLRQRCARWLLMTHDRTASADFPMTHEFLASILGVRRPSVSLALSELARAGIISGYHGGLRLLDRQALEDATCDCYAVIRRQFDAVGA